MSVLAELRAAAWPAHQRLERALDIGRRFSEPAAYRAHLARMYGFCRALERSVGPARPGDLLDDWPSRRRSALLERDLGALGLAPGEVADLPQAALPPRADAAAALGCLYVVEGATLGGRSLLPLVARRLGYGPARGAAFLASHGEDVEAKWAAFCATVERECAPADRRDRAVAAAVETFENLHRWLCGDRPA